MKSKRIQINFDKKFFVFNHMNPFRLQKQLKAVAHHIHILPRGTPREGSPRGESPQRS